MEYFVATVTLTRLFGDGIKQKPFVRLVKASNSNEARLAVYRHLLRQHPSNTQFDIEIEETIIGL